VNIVDSIISNLVGMLLSGGPHAISAVLLLCMIGLLIDRRRLIADLAKKEDKLDKIIEDYYRGNMTLADAMNSLKNVLFEIRNRI
jgi:hypothetical protein